MDQLVWVQPGAGEPAWTAGGTYMVVRTIRMHVEFWDRVGMLEQEQMIGRDRVSGAPLGGTDEFEDPRYDLDPKGKRIPLDAHIRLANPRTPADRRPADPAPRLQLPPRHRRGRRTSTRACCSSPSTRTPTRQFATIQKRLDDEPMTDYITPGRRRLLLRPAGRARAAATGSAPAWPRTCERFWRSAALPCCRFAVLVGGVCPGYVAKLQRRTVEWVGTGVDGQRLGF